MIDLTMWDIKMLRVKNIRYKISKVDTMNDNVLELREFVRVENNKYLHANIQDLGDMHSTSQM